VRDTLGHKELRGIKLQNDDLVYGPHSVADALETGRVRKIWIVKTDDKGKASSHREELAALAAKSGVSVERVPRTYLDSRMGRSNHQGIIAKVSPFPYTDFGEWLDQNQPPAQCLVIILDGIQDPGNFGHILRQAAGFLADGVIIPDRRAVGVTPTVEKTSAGNAGKVPVIQVGNLTRAIKELQKADIWVYAADMASKNSLTGAKFQPRSAWVVGSEHEGVSRLVLETCDETVSIPMPGPIESFNVATSAALGMYEYRRQFPVG
jgi:23S rRNA (guanosine2251-2'-O)-methyltransferase